MVVCDDPVNCVGDAVLYTQLSAKSSLSTPAISLQTRVTLYVGIHLDPVTRSTLHFLHKQRMVNQYRLKRQNKEKRAILVSAQAAEGNICQTKRLLNEIETRINRELEMNPQLREETD